MLVGPSEFLRLDRRILIVSIRQNGGEIALTTPVVTTVEAIPTFAAVGTMDLSGATKKKGLRALMR